MKFNAATLTFVLFCYATGMAQTNAHTVTEDFKPSTLNQPGKEYPQVNSQGYARFKIEAPAADSVRVSLGLGGRGGTKLQKVEDGSWMGTTEGPMDEGFHYYHVNVDGGTFNDPDATLRPSFKVAARTDSGSGKLYIQQVQISGEA